ncbi:MAG TPA: nucleotidyltransferase domain-containing protein [Tepidisphaeraceae bacterium]|jgi:predicted nucleotidyltransferase|nr:nucleotidyltransferase domain-containing protein [Tepidisphaeraceae bacterium]
MEDAEVAPIGMERLAVRLGKRWESIDRARERTASLIRELGETLQSKRLIPTDTSFVVFGSLARGEYTQGSDVDWTLLVDGQADPAHLTVSHEIARELKAKRLNAPGPAAVFGSVTFSHELIHHIGGQADSNRNTTQRILLLLESVPIGPADAYERVIRSIFSRYLDNDISFLTRSRSGEHYKVPRFLLNDIVRYWRTMCVDYATKFRERQGAEWALRNAKLRMPRKLIFASGLLTCFSCYLRPPPTISDLFQSANQFEPMVKHLRSFVGRPPTDILADAFHDYADEPAIAQYADSYADFLGILNDGTKREQLEHLRAEHARTDELFGQVRVLSDNFQHALMSLFFDSKEPKLRELTRKYGLF